MRGAWIEIQSLYTAPDESDRRSPCGERGLKCRTVCLCGRGCPSLPVRGAWIEITCLCQVEVLCRSLPVRGAWIEIAEISLSAIPI